MQHFPYETVLPGDMVVLRECGSGSRPRLWSGRYGNESDGFGLSGIILPDVSDCPLLVLARDHDVAYVLVNGRLGWVRLGRRPVQVSR